jgi:hypothetical protein
VPDPEELDMMCCPPEDLLLEQFRLEREMMVQVGAADEGETLGPLEAIRATGGCACAERKRDVAELMRTIRCLSEL